MPDDTPGITAPTLPGTVPDAPDKPKSKRSTTRAGRRAESAAKRATKAAAPDKAPSSSRSSSSSKRQAALNTRLTDALVGLGLGVRGIGAVTGSELLDADGVLIVKQGPAIGDALTRVAEQDPKVRAALERVLTVSVYGQLLSAVLPLAVGIAANHGMVPPQLAVFAGADPGVAEQLDQAVAAYREQNPSADQAAVEAFAASWLMQQNGAAAAPAAAVSAPAA